MPSHFSTIGFSVESQDDFVELAQRYWERLRRFLQRADNTFDGKAAGVRNSGCRSTGLET